MAAQESKALASLFLVIMAGGSGTRFWPKSTSKRPKQLLGFGKDSSETLLGATLSRFEGVVPANQRMIVTTEKLGASVRECAKGAEVLAEPQGRNTAPCVYWAARVIASRNPGAIMAVMPSDHYFAYPEKFRITLRAAYDWALAHDDLVTLGVRPSRPETGYGYLRIGAPKGGVTPVEAFVEKPNLARAQEFLAAGNYLWNGGMFLWKVSTILAAFDQFMPEMKRSWDASSGDVARAYPQMTATSIDYGVMEKAKNVVTFSLDCGWDDLGSWTSLEELADTLHARQGPNVVTGGELIAVEAEGNIVDAKDRLVALLGVRDLIVVEHEGTLLVAPKSRAQDIKQIVEKVKQERPERV